MPLSEESKKRKAAYNEAYKAKTYRRYLIRVRLDDTEVIEKLNSIENVQGYIVNLIRADIEKGKQQ